MEASTIMAFKMILDRHVIMQGVEFPASHVGRRAACSPEELPAFSDRSHVQHRLWAEGPVPCAMFYGRWLSLVEVMNARAGRLCSSVIRPQLE